MTLTDLQTQRIEDADIVEEMRVVRLNLDFGLKCQLVGTRVEWTWRK